MVSSPRPAPIPRPVWVAVLLILLAMGTAVTRAQWQWAPTFDEANHITRGLAIWRTGDYRLSLHHPPLANLLEAAPLAWHPDARISTAMPAWTSLNIWEAARTTLWEESRHGVQLVHLARLPVLLFWAGLGLVIFLWATELFGPWGGLLALSVFALDPTMLAHAGLATTDVAAASTFALACYLARRAQHQPSLGRWAVAGVGCGLALATKFSMLLLVPIVGLVMLWEALCPVHPALAACPIGLRIRRQFGAFLLVGLCAGITVWGLYGFRIEPLGSKPGQTLAASASRLERLPVPALQYVRGLKTVATEVEGHRAYLLGQSDETGRGWWYYFPVALAAKTPFPELLLLLGALIALPVIRRSLARGELRWIGVPAGVYLLAALGVLGISLNLGLRHLLPLYPFFCIAAGALARVAVGRRGWGAAVGVLVLLQGVVLLRAHPDWLAYFNEAGGGTARGYRVLVDSNYDWGQDLSRLAAVQRAEGWPTLDFSYFGSTPPEVYGLDYRPLAGFGLFRTALAPTLSTYRGWLAISATNLVGGPAYSGVDYRPLLAIRPYRRVGTIFVYRLPAAPSVPSPSVPR
jgi:hypothetical protein